MADLASVPDIEARLGYAVPNTARAAAVIADASALVRSFTRQSFDLVEDDEVTLRPVGTVLRLPQRPVVEVVSVAAVTQPLGSVALSGWVFDGIDKIDIDYSTDYIVNLPEAFDEWNVDSYTVVYSHGYTEPPADVVAVVCGIALRVITAPSLTEGMVSETIGQYGYQTQQGTGSAGSVPRLTQADKELLVAAGWRRQSTTVQVS